MGQAPERFGIGRLFWLTSESIVAADLATRRVLLWNPAAASMFGYSAEEAIGMPLETLVPEELRDAHLAGIARYAAHGEARVVGSGAIDVPAITKHGDRLDIALTLTDVTDLAGTPCVLAVIRDVTAQRRAERDVELANGALREFIATASHDLRSPLSAVIGFAALLADGQLPDNDHRRAIAAIQRNATHAARLVDDLLTLSKLHAGAIRHNVEAVDLIEVVDHAMEQAGISARVQIAAGMTALTDRDHLTRILVNYLTNAQRYGVPPIIVQAADCAAHVSLAVIDAGPALEPGTAERLFTPFARADKAGRLGTGLGLSIVRALAELNGGQAFYDATNGDSRFCVELPVPR